MSNLPDWLDNRLLAEVRQTADEHYPNEVCGLFYRNSSHVNIQFRSFRSIIATPTECVADPHDVILFVYTVLETGGEVTATFHTHPGGQYAFSARDLPLQDWSETHVLFVRDRVGDWTVVVEQP